MILKNAAMMSVISAINKTREGRNISTFSFYFNVLILLFLFNGKVFTQPTISVVFIPSPFPQLCHSDCVDVEFVIENGSGNYNITIDYGNPPFTINNFQEGEVFHICNGGPAWPAYIYDDATRTFFSGPPNNYSVIAHITIIDFYDLALGQGTIGNPYFFFEIQQNIQPIQIPSQIICTSQSTGEIDLTSLEPDIVPSEYPGYVISVLWFEDAALTIPIASPSSFITSTTTVYASLSFFWNGPPYHVCTSEPIPIELIVTQLPAIDIPLPFEDCHDYTLPIITGQNISINAAYFTMPNGSGVKYDIGDVISNDITLYIHDGILGCEDEVSFDIDILPRLYMEPQDAVSACGSYILPPIKGKNTNGQEKYYTLPNGGGFQYFPGDVVTYSTQLYLYNTTFDADCIDNQPIVDIEIIDIPHINTPTPVTQCTGFILPNISGNNLSGNEAYYSAASGGGIKFSVGDTIFSSDTIFLYDEINGCFSQVLLPITIGGAASAGRDSISLYCTSSIDTINLFKYLHTADTSGLWLHLNGDTITKPKKYPVNSLINDSLRYVVSHAQCGRDTALIVLKREAPPQAGSNSMVELCRVDSLIVNLDALIGNHDSLGLWHSSVDVFDSTSVDLSSLSQGYYAFSYIVSGKACAHDTALVSIDIVDFQSAGSDVSTAFCGNGFIDLTTLLAGQSLVGSFQNPNAVSGLSGSIWNTSSLPPGDYSFIHHIDNSGVCADDDAAISITLTDDLSAGDDVSHSLCYVSSIDLTAYLSNAHSGGVFIENGLVLSSEMYSPQANFATTLLYVVGQGTSCPLDTATIFIQTLDVIDTSYLKDQSCDPSYALAVGSEVFDINHVSGNVVLTSASGCDSIVNVSLSFLPIQSSVFMHATCDSSYSVAIGSQVFDINHPIGDVVLTAASGCDSIVSVALSFVPSFNSSFTKQTCDENYSITIGGEVFDINHAIGEVILTAISGCDSIVSVALSFLPTYNTSFFKQTCDENYSITIGGEVFDINHKTGDVVLTSALGCDSTVNVDLSFLPSYNTSFAKQTCDEFYSITIGGEVFDINNTSGEVVLTAASGCDSIVSVALSYVPSFNTSFTKQTCDESYTITIGGEVFDINHANGNVVLSSVSGCDSIVSVALSFVPSFNSNFALQTCDENYSITIGGEVFDINHTNGDVVLTSASGCDSVVNVGLSFLPQLTSSYSFATCDSSYSISIGSQIFDVNHAVGDVVLTADSGCDSVVNVALSFLPSYQATIVQHSCDEDFSFVVGSTVFDLNNPSGIASLQTSSGCDSIVNVDLDFQILPTLTLDQSLEQILILGDLSSVTQLSWSPNLGLSCDDCTSPFASPFINTKYVLSYSNDLGCIDTASLLFIVQEKDDGIVFPNVINTSSSSNQYFYLPKAGLTILSMKIYDRWGNTVFSNHNFASGIPELGWNGQFNNREVIPGVFVYFTQIMVDGVVKDFVGDVTVVR